MNLSYKFNWESSCSCFDELYLLQKLFKSPQTEIDFLGNCAAENKAELWTVTDGDDLH